MIGKRDCFVKEETGKASFALTMGVWYNLIITVYEVTEPEEW